MRFSGVLLHGWLGSWGLWQETMAYLGQGYRTYALDFWGFGESGKKRESYAVQDFVRLVVAQSATIVDQFMALLGIERAPLVGHSIGDAVTKEDIMVGDCPTIIENIVAATNQSKGSVLAVLAELDVQIEAGLKAGRIVQLPNGTHFEPVGKKDGSVNIMVAQSATISVRVNPDLDKKVNTGFRGKWVNSENIGKNEADIVVAPSATIVALWNTAHPNDPIE